MAKKSAYVEFITEQVSPLGEITARAMFGGYCLYCNGTVFALIADDVLYLKADDENRPDFERIGAKPFQPFPDKSETMSYYPPPAEFFDNADEMEKWAASAIAAGRRAKSSRAGRRGRAWGTAGR